MRPCQTFVNHFSVLAQVDRGGTCSGGQTQQGMDRVVHALLSEVPLPASEVTPSH